ncbi:2,5-dihydroxypyridine 5,6-dioxygenase [Sneathiella sp. HT1-7]|jgi:2,5-dihydroxypyridine 5,6-dioxygenase|uniref:2,5-dihydroxypyridine 5,6-dioxygenase n=1 Tax=Sneathiella sp. HT1-7 TaxID=2887192 RepID=UPI001D13D4F3|nr:2,5-dihydroxypyridine 5,6-dioxygenase [Sneathiella sp. HT1-7]MCC3305126.1 2,5-dihydroxypyridine 5,6-dioxygenase [Sneathiella sp. HT1-7]
MPVSDYQMITAWTEVLKLSELQKGQIVTILTSINTHPQTLSTATIAVQSFGAIVSRIDLPPVNGEKALSRDPLAYLGTTPLTGNTAVIEALKQSDIVLDLMTLLFSPEQMEILETGTKILLAVEPPEVLARMIPTIEDKSRVLKAKKVFEQARVMKVTSPAGTDLTCQLGEFPVIGEYGFVDEPGRWDHWPSGFLFSFPNEGGSEGRIIIDKGDILLPQKSYLQESIIVEMLNGYAVDISGGWEAELLSEYMDSFKDPEAYAMSHIGWGLQPRAKRSTLGLYDREATIGMDARAYEGNFLFSLGPNNEAGGSRTTACHMDIPLRNCTVSLDGVEVVRDGKVLDEAFQ